MSALGIVLSVCNKFCFIVVSSFVSKLLCKTLMLIMNNQKSVVKAVICSVFLIIRLFLKARLLLVIFD